MRLLELHIRNIASIEKADIDFENQDGLMDPDTGRPSQMFLIFGDTGTGKSILLDCIAMALFKNTPRIASVSSRTRNSFTSNNGAEVKIYSIEQYTRIGISHKDECYSEVAFIGNDGQHYLARLELGINRNGNYKSAWVIKAGEADWVKVDKEGKLITNAIGLSFDQFCRMAMLAQGQFSSFLCGDKKERADILEKLTNTSIFSLYGSAIKNLHDKKRTAFSTAEATYNEALKHITAPEELQLLEQQRSEAVAAIISTHNRHQALDNQVRMLQKIDDAINNIGIAETRLSELKATKESDLYKERMQLITDWDSTDEERKWYSDLLLYKNQLEQASSAEAALHTEFNGLCILLANQVRQTSDKELMQQKKAHWIDERKHLDLFFNKAPVICANLDSYLKTTAKISELQKNLSEQEGKKPALIVSLNKAKEAKEASDKESLTAQQDIEKLTSQRDALNAKEIVAQLQSLARLDTAYAGLLSDIENYHEKQDKYAKLNESIIEVEKSRARAAELQGSLQKRCDMDRLAYESARNRFTTISASLDDKINELRHKMASGHTDICPLCGQKIANGLLTTEQFRDIVSPFEKEQQAAKEVADHSINELDKANKELNDIDGQLKVMRNTALASSKEINETKLKLDVRMGKAEVAWDDNPAETIRLRRDKIADDSALLDEKKQQADKLQDEIDIRLKRKKETDKKKSQNDNAYIAANNNFLENANIINNLTKQIEQEKGDASRQELLLDSDLSCWYSDQSVRWKDDIVAVRQRLASEAEEYLNTKREHEKAVLDLNAEKERNAQMTELRDKIKASHPSWDIAEATTVDGTHRPVSSPSQWNDLAQRCFSVANTIVYLRGSIDQCNESLAGWQLASGKDTGHLARLIALREEISSVRQYLEAIKTQQALCEKSIADGNSTIAESRKALNLSEDDILPDRQKLILEMNVLEEAENKARELFANADTKIKTNLDNQDNLRQVSLAMQKAKAVYDHWEVLNKHFGGDRFRNLVQTYILRPLLNNANLYLRQISDRYTLTCSEDNEQLSILVLDSFNRNETRSAAVLSGGEKFMISLALSLALSSLNRPDLNTNILFIDEGFGTLDQECLDSVMKTLGRLPEITGQSNRRVGIISHREELLGCIPNKIKLVRCGEGRSRVEVCYEP